MASTHRLAVSPRPHFNPIPLRVDLIRPKLLEVGNDGRDLLGREDVAPRWHVAGAWGRTVHDSGHQIAGGVVPGVGRTAKRWGFERTIGVFLPPVGIALALRAVARCTVPLVKRFAFRGEARLVPAWRIGVEGGFWF